MRNYRYPNKLWHAKREREREREESGKVFR
jgi:hypothetical protein